MWLRPGGKRPGGWLLPCRPMWTPKDSGCERARVGEVDGELLGLMAELCEVQSASRDDDES